MMKMFSTWLKTWRRTSCVDFRYSIARNGWSASCRWATSPVRVTSRPAILFCRELPALIKNSMEITMKAVVFHGVGDIRLEDVPEPQLQEPTDAIVRLTASAICGTDLHFIRGTVSGMEPGTILGHEGVGVVEALGDDVRNLQIGDRVVIPSTIACGNCSYCRAGYYAQCDDANPNGKQAGTAFFGGPANTGSFHGLQAEKARIPYANVGLIKLPDAITDDQAI